jgi:hypothetical protein
MTFPAKIPTRERLVNSVVRACIATARAQYSKGMEPATFLRQKWPDDEVADWIVKASSEPPTEISTTAPLAKIVVAELIEAMTPYSAGARLTQFSPSFTFDGAAYVSVPSFAATAAAAAYVGEGAPIPVVQLSDAGASMTPKKVSSIVVLTEELLEASNAEAYVRDVLTRTIGLAVDAVMFDTNPATAIRPPGLLNGISATTPSTATSPGDAMVADMSKLAGLVSHVGGRIGFIMSPGRCVNVYLRSAWYLLAENAAYRDIDIMPSNAIPDNEVVCVAEQGMVTVSDGAPQISASRDATVHMEGATPQPISGSPGVVASPTRSLWQTRSVGLKVRFALNWALRDPLAVAYMTGITAW